MPSSLDIDLAALTLATAHYRLINDGLIDQASNIYSLDSYKSISAFLDNDNCQGDMFVSNCLLGVSFNLFTNNKTTGTGYIKFVNWKTELIREQYFLVPEFRSFKLKNIGYRISLGEINKETKNLTIYEIAKKIHPNLSKKSISECLIDSKDFLSKLPIASNNSRVLDESFAEYN